MERQVPGGHRRNVSSKCKALDSLLFNIFESLIKILTLFQHLALVHQLKVLWTSTFSLGVPRFL